MGTKKNKKKNKNNKAKKYSNENNSSSRRDKLRKIAAENLGKFREQLSKIGLRIKESGGDGNCLFRSFADQMEGTEDNYKFYRKETLDHMVQNRNNFEPFIEDDQKFDDYISMMTIDGKWGGNLEIQALSMRFKVNLYIHIYNHPMYIVRNFDSPFRNVHLSYHDGVLINLFKNHYNSVRLADDLADEVPLTITNNIIQGIKQTSDLSTLLQIEEKNNEVLDEDENKSDISDSENEEENKNISEKKNDNQFIYDNVTIKASNEKNKKKCIKMIFSPKEGKFMPEQNDNKKCYCSSNKKYRNCCKSEDITGDMDTDIFFCDIDKFKKFYDNYQKNKDSNDKKNLKNYNLSKSNINDCPNKNSNCENNSIVDKMSEIFI